MKKVAVISDIHIGTNIFSNWYRKGIHEPYLQAVFQWVIDHKDEIDQLMILGDLLDFWTYPPDMRPPSTAEIIKENEAILGENGMLAQVYTALGGDVVYMNGNHDISLKQADLDLIGNAGDNIRLIHDHIHTADGVTYTHGHIHTLFNAPDPSIGMPVGHFVTRAVSYYLQQNNLVAVEQAGFGVPPKLEQAVKDQLFHEVEKLIAQWVFGGQHVIDEIINLPVVPRFLNAVQEATQLGLDEVILMPDGSKSSLRDAISRYADVWKDWVLRFGGGEKGIMFAYKALWADYDGYYMGWYAQRQNFENQAGLAVMGHTHVDKLGLKSNITNYMNTGFECVPVPELEKGEHHFNFGVVTTENGVGEPQVKKVTKTSDGVFAVKPDSAPPAAILGENASDFSCYLTIQNKTDNTYVYDKSQEEHGYFVAEPPAQIDPHSSVRFWLQDFPGAYGTEGNVTYHLKGDPNHKLPFSFQCVHVYIWLVNMNECSGGSYFLTKVEDVSNPWGKPNDVATKGNPFFVKFVIE